MRSIRAAGTGSRDVSGIAFFALWADTVRSAGPCVDRGRTGGQPKFTLRMSVNKGNGIVDVRGASGYREQTLSCPLAVPPFAPGLEDARKEVENFLGRMFVNELVAGNYNFDGYVDLRAPGEYAASFKNYSVWLYDPVSRTFVHDGADRGPSRAHTAGRGIACRVGIAILSSRMSTFFEPGNNACSATKYAVA
jgi:hypothetical protein